MNRKTIVSLLLVALLIAVEAVAELPDTIDKIRGSVVGIGTVFPSAKHRDAASPPMTFRGTGFAVGNGRQVDDEISRSSNGCIDDNGVFEGLPGKNP